MKLSRFWGLFMNPLFTHVPILWRLLACGVLLFTSFSGASADTTLDNTGDLGFGVTTFGNPGTGDFSIVGQTFKAPGTDTVIQDLMFWFDDYGTQSLPFQAFLYKWSGTAPTGPALFTSPVYQILPGTHLPYFINFGAVGLEADQTYIAYFATVPGNTGGPSIYPSLTHDNYADGNYVPWAANQPWQPRIGDLEFLMHFTAPTPQVLHLNPFADKTYGDLPITVVGGTDVGPQPVYTSSNEAVAKINGVLLQIMGVGTAVITASSVDPLLYPATPVMQTLTVNKASQTINVDTRPTTVAYGTTTTIAANATSTLPVAFASLNPAIATVNATTGVVTPVAVGSTSIRVSQSGNANYNPATDATVPLNVIKGSQTITGLPPTIAQTFSVGGTYTLTGAVGSGLGLTYTSDNDAVATVSGNVVTIQGGGTVTITAHQAGNGMYNAASDVSQILTVAKANQVINGFSTATNAIYGDTVTPTGSATSGLPVTFTSSDETKLTFNGGNVGTVLSGTGSVVVSAIQAGNASYQPAPTLMRTITLGKKAQSITGLPSTIAKNYAPGATFTLGASATSGLTVSYASNNPSVATVTGNVVTIWNVGIATIAASQTGDENYSAANEVSSVLTVSQGTQTITGLPATLSATYGTDATLTLSAQSSAGLPVSYTSSNPAVATVTGNVVTIVGAGATTITASNPGNTQYTSASVTSVLTVAKGTPLITFPVLPPVTRLTADFDPGATSPSSAAVTYVSDAPLVAEIVAGKIHIVGQGPATITASVAEDANWNAASPFPRTLVVAPATQTVNVDAPAGWLFSDGTFTVTASATSGLSPVTFSVESGPATIQSVNATTGVAVIKPSAVGSVRIKASQAGDAIYSAASVTVEVIISQGEQTITFDPLPAKGFTDLPFALGARALSGLEVTYTSSQPGVASVSGNIVTIHDTGATIITAHQAGDGDWNAASDVSQTLTIGQAGQTILFYPLGSTAVGSAQKLIATASSGLPVSFRVTSGEASLSGNRIVLTSAGKVTIEATQAGSSQYTAATPVAIQVVATVGASGPPIDPLSSLYIATPAVTADPLTGTATLTVQRAAGKVSATVHFRTLDNTAKAGTDYVATDGALTFAAGETSKSLSIPMMRGATTGRTFTVALYGPGSGTTLGTPSAAVVTVTRPVSAYLQMAEEKYRLAGQLFAAGDTQNAYQAYADYFYCLYQDEADWNPASARNHLNEYYRNLAAAYYLAYHNQGDEAAAYAWYAYLLTFVR